MNGTNFCLITGMPPGLLYIVDKLAQTGRLECVVIHHTIAKRHLSIRSIVRSIRDFFEEPRRHQARIMRSHLTDYDECHVIDKHVVEKLRLLADKYAFDLILKSSINTDNQVCEYLKQSTAQYALTLGGPVLKPAILKSFNGMWLNCHGGFLPYYRGLWSEYWAIKNGDFDKIGWTIHELVERIDAGKIFQKEKVVYNPDETLEELTLRVHSQMITGYIAFAKALPNSTIKALQHKVETKYYYSRPKSVSLDKVLQTKVRCL